ncbi:MAG: HIT family protein [Anaerolineaceae bacterium]|nr:HIT family protein [Anaerolineaceae bacterium]
MYNHAPDDYTCPFCMLIRGIRDPRVWSEQSDIVYHDESVTAFISAHQYPNNPGNTLVTPNEHFENIYELPVACVLDIHRAAKRLALAMKLAYGCDGVSTRQHNEPSGNQDVWHYHMHITPRYQNDHFYGSHPARMPVEERARHAEMLRRVLEEVEIEG